MQAWSSGDPTRVLPASIFLPKNSKNAQLRFTAVSEHKTETYSSFCKAATDRLSCVRWAARRMHKLASCSVVDIVWIYFRHDRRASIYGQFFFAPATKTHRFQKWKREFYFFCSK
jgi:hypothetical protein